jgi:hypothetical protein
VAKSCKDMNGVSLLFSSEFAPPFFEGLWTTLAIAQDLHQDPNQSSAHYPSLPHQLHQ